jgi:hypothetical protein
MNSEIDALRRWKSLGEGIRFTAKDFDVLDLALSLIPDLRICALAVKQARKMKVEYPIESVDGLIRYLGDKPFVAGDHVIDLDEIRTYLPAEIFPIEHEGELLSLTYAALGRQRREMALLSTVHPNAIDKFVAARGAQEVRDV